MSTRLFLYVVSASDSPERVECLVPWEVDSREIFFGPCKKRLRQLLRKQYLAPGVNLCRPAEDIYLVGVNGSNARRNRKIVWAGRVTKFMTFARARLEMAGERYDKLRKNRLSPLHVTPLLVDDELRGYQHVSRFHKDGWWMDLIASQPDKTVHVTGNRLLLRSGVSPWEGFPRDVCALCENIVFARGSGLAIDAEALEMLRRAQPDVKDIDPYAVFGRPGGRVEGLRGRWLEMHGDLADGLVTWIRRFSPGSPQLPRAEVVAAPCNSSS